MSHDRRFEDLTGQKFARLTVVERCSLPGRGRVRWKCICDCGNTIEAQAIHLKQGTIRSCKCLKDETNRVQYGMAAARAVYSRYQCSADDRNLSFDLLFEDLVSITSSDCFYCNTPPSQIKKAGRAYGNYIYNGIDRIDNAVGYELWNCVPCCGTCNHMKGTMSHNDFVKHIEAIKKHSSAHAVFERKDKMQDNLMKDMLMQKQIAASILSQDQLVFSYRHRNDDDSEELVVRFATPIELDETCVKCYQHLPEQGYRKFKLEKIVSFNRVQTRGIPFVSSSQKEKDIPATATPTAG